MKAPVKQVVAVVTREITVRSAENILNLIETDQVAPAGRWRLRLDGDKVYLDRATAADWSTYETWLTYDKASEKLILGKKLDANTLKIENLGPPDSDDDVPRRDTIDSKITTHETGGKHRWTLDKLLKGAGAGADPTEIDVPGKSIATGTYTGNGAAGRQITVGFKCSMVIIQYPENDLVWGLIPNCTIRHFTSSPYHDEPTPNTYLHASDGFVVDSVTGSSNANGFTFYYWAISE